MMTTMTRIPKTLVLMSLLIWSAPLLGQTINSLTAQEKAQGWQLLFDGKTLKGWHASAPVQGRGAAGAPQPQQPAPPAQPGALAQVGASPKPCASPASQWEVADGLLMPCGTPP